MSVRYLIGIDLGTTAAKCVVYDENGTVVSEAQQEMRILYPRSGEAEQDAMDFYTVSCDLIKKCLKKRKIAKRNIAALSIDSQMGGIMSVDKHYNPVTYYDTPLDSRSSEENLYMHEHFGDLILRKNGSLSTFGNKILYWKKKPEWKAISKFIQPSAFVAGKLAGLSGDEAYMDESFLCFSGLADLKRSRWSSELCEKLEVDEKKLPKVVRSTDIIGEVCKKAANDTGLPEGIPIAAGCGDQAAGFVGAGVFRSGQMVDVSGTACIFAAGVGSFCYDKKHKTVACMKAALGNMYYLMSVVLGGRTHNWFIEEFCREEEKAAKALKLNIYAYLDKLAESLEPGSGGLVAVDYLQGRFFPAEPDVRGMFIGHTWAHKKVHFYRAILESIAYDHYLTKQIIQALVPDLDLKSVTAIGSGANSTFWMKIKADVLQVPYRNLQRSDLATLGAAIIGGYAAGLFKNTDEITKKFAQPKNEVFPEHGAQEAYMKYIEVYRDLFACTRPLYKKLSS